MSETNSLIKVLLIDEVAEDVTYFCAQLDRASGVSFEPIILPDLQSACQYLQRNDTDTPPDVIALNLALKGCAGLEALEQLLPEAKSIPVVAISGRDDQELGLRAVRAGAQDYLVMGRFDCELLVRTLRYATERVRAEQALRESEQRFQLAISGSNEGLFDWDINSDQLYASPRLISIFGFDPSAFDDGLDEIVRRAHPDDCRRLRDQLRSHLRDNSVFDVDFRIADVESQYRWLQVRGASVRDPNGRATRMVGSVLDIRERKRAEAALKESQSFFKLILDSVPISIAYVESDETINFANRQYLDWFHVDRAVLIGKRIRDIVTDDDYGVIRPRIDRVLMGETVSYSAAVERTGTVYELEVSYIPHRNDSGNIVGFFSVMQDVTENRKLEAELRQAQKMEAIGQLTGGVAHDFNNLLSIIVGNLQLLSRPLKEDEHLIGLVNSALRASLRGADLTKRLLAMSRRQMLEPQLLDLNETVAAMDELLRRTLDSDIKMTSHFDADLHLATIDPGQLENALLNLVINARDAMPDGGTLNICTENMMLTDENRHRFQDLEPGNYVVLVVSDTGVGMTPDQLRQAFEPFYTTKDVGKGSGLGLSMVYGFLEQSGGIADISSEPNAGTQVRLIFPQATEDATTGEHPLLDEDMPRGNECVLVVEDDPDVRVTTIALLAELGYQTLEAGDGPSALRIIESHPEIDLLFTDVMMPGGMRGPVVAMRANEVRPDLPVIFATGFAESTIMHNGAEASLESVICKPYSHDELAKKVRRMLDGDKVESLARRA